MVGLALFAPDQQLTVDTSARISGFLLISAWMNHDAWLVHRRRCCGLSSLPQRNARADLVSVKAAILCPVEDGLSLRIYQYD